MNKIKLLSNSGVFLNAVVLKNNNGGLADVAYTVSSDYTPEEPDFSNLIDARAHFDVVVHKYTNKEDANA